LPDDDEDDVDDDVDDVDDDEIDGCTWHTTWRLLATSL